MYPGSFNPPTIAHVAIANVALEQYRLDSIAFAVSQRALAKEANDAADRPTMTHRLEVLREMAKEHDGFEVLPTEKQLIADIAEGFDVVILGTDKWNQILDPVFYNNDLADRDAAIARLPAVALFPRPPLTPQPSPIESNVETLRMNEETNALMRDVSSSKARAGQVSLMADAARRFDLRTGAWTDPERYAQTLNG